MESEKERSYTIVIGASPREADIAIVSISSKGTVGELNQMVLNEYGYDKSILNQLNLEKGFDLFQPNGKPILFVVTVGTGNPINNLNENLSQAITFHFQFLSNKKIWIPLMATGSGRISYLDSYKTTISILEHLKDFISKFNCQFIISIPNDEKGKSLFKQIEEGFDKGISKPELSKLNFDSAINEIKNNNSKNNPKEVNDLIEHLNANYHFVGIDWEGKNQTNRFFKEGIWETGYGDRFTGVIKNILVDDILIIKEPYKISDKSYNKIIAIGKVVENPMDGKRVKVDWIVKDLSFDIIALGYNDSTITTAHLDSVKEIFSKIKSKELQKIKSSIVLRIRTQSEKIETLEEKKNSIESNPIDDGIGSIEIAPETNITTIAGIHSDIDDGEDYFDIRKDVHAFARVMAAKSFEPPLAIALLGKWGSGKSFFMKKLKDGIQNLSSLNPEKGFCEGIAHVHFNAWSYMDANLWASIVTRIFEGLNEYIKNDTKANSFKKEIEKKLTQNLNIAKEEIATLEKQNKNINAQIEKLTIEKRTAEVNLKEKIKAIRTTTIKAIIENVDDNFKVTEQIDDALKNNKTFINSTDRLKKIVPEQYWMNPDELYKQIKSKYTFIKTFFYGENWWKNCLWLAGLLIIVLYTPIFTFIATLLLSWQDFTLTPKTWTLITFVGTICVRGIDTYKKLKTLIAPFWKIKINYETEKENALFEFNQQEKALNLEIENSKNEINAINEQISKAIVIKASIEFKLENALSTEALYSFIERRANSEDYKKHLGIVSIIRKDFEVLSDLLVDHKQETDKNVESKEFNEMFNNPLERIILYIDDLDRCPEERVVEVLEAVNLLMAFPLFVVVVGVDPRWVKTALLKKYENQFNNDVEDDKISPSNYLEKIFQVPFHLKDANDFSIKHMIKTLAQAKPNIIRPIDDHSLDTNNEPTSNIVESVDLSYGSIQTDHIYPKSFLYKKESIEALEITEQECELLQDMSEIIGNNPRAIKRFVNIYRIAKTHEDFSFNKETDENELLVVMFLLAFSMGEFKDLLKSFDSFLDVEAYGFDTLGNFLKILSKNADEKNEKLKKNKIKKLYIIINSKRSNLLEQNVDLFRKHSQFIKRFTFKNI